MNREPVQKFPNREHILIYSSDASTSPLSGSLSFLEGFSWRRLDPAIISLYVQRQQWASAWKARGRAHLFLMASFRPILRASLTVSARLTLPICLRFIFDGLGSFNIQSGTDDPDCNNTFAMLESRSLR